LTLVRHIDLADFYERFLSQARVKYSLTPLKDLPVRSNISADSSTIISLKQLNWPPDTAILEAYKVDLAKHKELRSLSDNSSDEGYYGFWY